MYVPQTRILVANAENLSFICLRNLLKGVRVRVHDILSNVSLIFSRTCPRYSVERVHERGRQHVHQRVRKRSKNIKKNEKVEFFVEKIHILVANALRKSEHF